MIFVKASSGDTSDSLIRKFTKKIINEGFLIELKRKEFYQKPSEIRKEANNEIQRRIKSRKRNKKRV